MRVLITGVAGFVGWHLAAWLRETWPDAELFGLDRPHGAMPAEPPREVTSLVADLDDRETVFAAVERSRPDRVVHLAGQSSVQYSWTDPGSTLRTNLLGAVHLLEALRAIVPGCTALMIGSAEEYGAAEIADPPFREDHPLRPRNPYAVSKAAQGLLALGYAEPGVLSVLLTRTFPHTGPRRGEAFAESSFARQLAEIGAGRRDPVIEVGNLDAVRDFADVRDVVRAYALLLERGESGGIYNVCTGSGVSIRQVLDTLIDLSGLEVEVRVDRSRLRPSDVPCLVGDPSRLKALGWEPGFDLRQTLHDLLADWKRRVQG